MHHHTITCVIGLAVVLAALAGSRYARRALHEAGPREGVKPQPCAAVSSLGSIIGSLDGAPIYEWVRLQVFDGPAAPRQITLRFDGIGSGTPRHHFTLDGDCASLLVGRVLYTTETQRT